MSKTRARREHHLKLLLLFTVIAMVGFGFPRLLWATHVGYTLIALLLTQVWDGRNMSRSGVGGCTEALAWCRWQRSGSGS